MRNFVHRPQMMVSNERGRCGNVDCEQRDLPFVLRGTARCACRPDLLFFWFANYGTAPSSSELGTT